MTGEAYGRFLSAIFDEWAQRDVGRIFPQLFEECLGVWPGRKPSLCIFAETCGRGLAIEHNGDVFSYDHFVDPPYNLGNIAFVPLEELADSPEQIKFRNDKRDKLPQFCRECDVRFICNGGCPKDRFIRTPDGEEGLNFLCAGYRQFFRHIAPVMQRLADLCRQGIHPAAAMAELRVREAARWASAGRNDPCPCGSGHKYKHCCLGQWRNLAQ